MTPEYKAQKEASVSFLGGGGIWEINHVALVAPAAAFLWAMLQTRQNYFKQYTIAAAFSDFLIQCCAILFATTVYAGAPQILNGLLILPAVAAFLQPSPEVQKAAKPPAKLGSKDKTSDEDANEDKGPLPVKPFITAYRGAMMIITCSSILAVDFPVFPRRFAKTESFGTSLMDMGVGSFVFAAGIVAARQQLKEDNEASRSLMKRLKSAFRHSLPLVVLGFIRLWSVKSLEYAEHVSEYGVHWNFFFTLALLSPAIAILQPILRYTEYIGGYNIFAFALAIGYELILFCVPDMKAYIILSERKPGDWLSQNREGVFSFIGYFAIFIAGMGAGVNILTRDPETSAKKIPEKDPLDADEDWLASVLGAAEQEGEDIPAAKPARSADVPKLKPEWPAKTLPRLGALTFLWFVFATWAMWKYGPRLFVSRRMANLAYVCWVCTFNYAQLLLFNVIETVLFPNLYKAKTKEGERSRIAEATSPIMRAYNRNGLAIFLLANLLTGLVNLTLPTIHMGDVPAMTVLVGYMAVLTAVALGLDHYNISIKL
ncbi:Putative phosphatidylinositol anchor biosynthesis protein PIGW/GWT1 [Septoria linicola]|uniref:GPI-anchored wall transfer protein n=1 Tax=Septoria linicola TaxID=215465 RepID=A0A9Q9ARG1_9PEZI|nr:Putative phosphatidylinositol anchor biosynthesis protein PIGW/GWT1 [Septoria linicola]